MYLFLPGFFPGLFNNAFSLKECGHDCMVIKSASVPIKKLSVEYFYSNTFKTTPAFVILAENKILFSRVQSYNQQLQSILLWASWSGFQRFFKGNKVVAMVLKQSFHTPVEHWEPGKERNV